MMNKKKLAALFSCLVCLSVCIFLLSFCGDNGGTETTLPSESIVETTEPVTEVPTEETTQAPAEETTEAPAEETTEEPTQPTQLPGSNSAGQNTVPQQTEPEETEPEETVAVPAPGAENNAYVEYFTDAAGVFTTVKIPAGQTINYMLKTPASYMQIQDSDIRVVWDEETYKAQDGVLELDLPADGETPMAMLFVNKGKKDKIFTVNLLDAKGSATNPYSVKSISALAVSLHKGKTDAEHFVWTADSDGMLRVGVAAVKPKNTAVEVTLTVNGAQVNLSESANGVVQISVSKGDRVSVAVSGNGKTAEATLSGYILPVEQLTVNQIPSSVQTVSVPAQNSVIYQIYGANGNILRIKHANATVLYNGKTYAPDANRFVELQLTDEPAQIELCNTGSKDISFTFSFSYPLGHYYNPEKLTDIESNTVNADADGYWYSYTAAESGELVIGARKENVEIFLLNERTRQYANLWYTDENGVSKQAETVCVDVEKGDKVSVQILYAENVQLDVTGWIAPVYAVDIQTLPHSLKTGKIEAGRYVYYDISGAAGNVLTVKSKNLTIVYDGVTYEPDENKILSVKLTEDTARIKLMNTGKSAAAFTLNIHYPVGHSENAQPLTSLGQIDVVFESGVYHYTYTAQQDGQISFCAADTDTYIVLTNLESGETNNLWYTDQDGNVIKNENVSISAKPGDSIAIQVYAMGDGQTMSTITGREDAVEKISVETLPFSVDTAQISAGSYAFYQISGAADKVLTVCAANARVICNGIAYTPDENGNVILRIPEDPALLQICNTAAQDDGFTLSISHPVGHPENPETLTALGELNPIFEAGSYYYSYEAKLDGKLVFGTDDTDTYIVLVNETTGETVSLWYTDSDGQLVKYETVALDVAAGDKVTVQVFAMAAEMISARINGLESYALTLTQEQLPTTVETPVIPAGESAFFLVTGIEGQMLHIQEDALTVVYNGQTCEADENGVCSVKLLSGKPVELCNTGDQDKTVSLRFDFAIGHANNPEVLPTLGTLAVTTENGSYNYVYTALSDGKVIFTTDAEDGDIRLTNLTTGETAALYTADDDEEPVKNAYVGVAVEAGQQVAVQILTDSEEDAQIQVTGVEAAVLELTDGQMPMLTETLPVETGSAVYYEIIGAYGNILKMEAADAVICCNGVTFEPDENGVITVKLGTAADAAVLLQISNNSDQQQVYELQISYPTGHSKNPEIITALGEMNVTLEKGTDGYFYTYTADVAGQFAVDLWEYPEDALTDVILTNSRTGTSVSLWTEDESGAFVFKYNTALPVLPGDKITMQVTLTALDDASVCIDGAVTLNTVLRGDAENPIEVFFPGFTAQIPAGKTLYYQGYNLSELLLNVSGNVAITYNGNTYNAVDGVASCLLLTAGRTPAVFALTNTGTVTASYDAKLEYPVGHNQNPDTLLPGENAANKIAAGMSDYIYTYIAPKDGTLKLTFDPAAQWIYAVDNLDQGIYGETCCSSDDPQLSETEIAVSTGDTVQIRVNTYDAQNPFSYPEGTVLFTAALYTGPVQIEDISQAYQLNMVYGETAIVEADASGQLLTVLDAQDIAVIIDGVSYTANESGNIEVTLPVCEGDTQTVTFNVYNAGAADKSCTLLFGNQKGTAANPDTLVVGLNTAVCSEGSEGYHFVFTATKTGMLKLKLAEGYTWKIQYGTTVYTSDTRDYVNLKLRANKSMEFIIYTYDPENPDEVPAGTVEFTVTFT